MSNGDNTLGHSPALGLWTRHPVVMDELYDLVDDDAPDPGTPKALINFAKGPERPRLCAVFAAALADARLLLDDLRDGVLARFARAPMPLIAEPSRIRDPWARRLRLQSRGEAVPQGPLSLEIHLTSLQSSPEQALYLVIYANGGGVRTRNLIWAWVQSERQDLTHQPAPDEHAHFGSNAVILYRCMLHDFLKGQDLDMGRLANTFLVDLEWLAPPQLRKLMEVMHSGCLAPA